MFWLHISVVYFTGASMRFMVDNALIRSDLLSMNNFGASPHLLTVGDDNTVCEINESSLSAHSSVWMIS